MQLALGDLVMLDDKRKHQELGHLRASGIRLTGGMMGFDGEDYSTIDRIRRTWRLRPRCRLVAAKRLSIGGGKLMKEVWAPKEHYVPRRIRAASQRRGLQGHRRPHSRIGDGICRSGARPADGNRAGTRFGIAALPERCWIAQRTH